MISREEETIQQGITKRQTTGEKQLTFVAVLRIHCDREAEDFTREVNWKLEKQRQVTRRWVRNAYGRLGRRRATSAHRSLSALVGHHMSIF